MRDLIETLEATDPYTDLHPETLAVYERLAGSSTASLRSR
jgi:hypothetical protein